MIVLMVLKVIAYMIVSMAIMAMKKSRFTPDMF